MSISHEKYSKNMKIAADCSSQIICEVIATRHIEKLLHDIDKEITIIFFKGQLVYLSCSFIVVAQVHGFLFIGR